MPVDDVPRDLKTSPMSRGHVRTRRSRTSIGLAGMRAMVLPPRLSRDASRQCVRTFSPLIRRRERESRGLGFSYLEGRARYGRALSHVQTERIIAPTRNDPTRASRPGARRALYGRTARNGGNRGEKESVALDERIVRFGRREDGSCRSDGRRQGVAAISRCRPHRSSSRRNLMTHAAGAHAGGAFNLPASGIAPPRPAAGPHLLRIVATPPRESGPALGQECWAPVSGRRSGTRTSPPQTSRRYFEAQPPAASRAAA